MNSAQLIGRLVKDPQLRYSSNNVAIVKFTLAVNRTFANKDGERDADFISCVAFKQNAENLSKYQKKGNRIAISGHIQTGSYEDNDGKRIYTTDIVCDNIQFLEPKQYNSEEAKQVQRDIQPKSKGESLDISESDLPF